MKCKSNQANEATKQAQVYNLFIIWNVNLAENVKSFVRKWVYNLFIIWNVNYDIGINAYGSRRFIICSLYEM